MGSLFWLLYFKNINASKFMIGMSHYLIHVNKEREARATRVASEWEGNARKAVEIAHAWKSGILCSQVYLPQNIQCKRRSLLSLIMLWFLKWCKVFQTKNTKQNHKCIRIKINYALKSNKPMKYLTWNLKWLKNIRAWFLGLSVLLKIEHTVMFNYGELLC